MIEVCLYCGTPRDGRMSCCGENHWEDVDPINQKMIQALVDMDKFEMIFLQHEAKDNQT